ncbi:hypothetical protein A0H81_14858 [Grifola frondosa]|uniref:Uncharacterized protein n=1 Tax=Grifola frondosa TaxID=5627 RepID=A0A1C7LK52_GRIFR|nr:hypothetical protein A0H81_14858 [Grifola frondosa]
MPPHPRNYRGTDSDLHPARCGASRRHRASVLLSCSASAALDTSSLARLIVYAARVQSAYNLSVFEHSLFQTTAQDHLDHDIEDDIEDEFHLRYLPPCDAFRVRAASELSSASMSAMTR